MNRLVAILVVWFGLLAVPAFGQGCAMCYTSATATTEQGKQALSKAVLILLVPPVSLFTGGMAVAFRYGKKRDEERSDPEV